LNLVRVGDAEALMADPRFALETPRHRVWLNPFLIAMHPVTHGDFIEFIDDAGYRRPELRLPLAILRPAPGARRRLTRCPVQRG
jgi:formylglycine-generating enzyme required for sulfatase activity